MLHSPTRPYSPDASDTVALVKAALILLDPQSNAFERVAADQALQQLASQEDPLSAQLPKGMLLYFQKDPRAFATLQDGVLCGSLWPVRMLLHEHFLMRCMVVCLGTNATHIKLSTKGGTRLLAFPMEHPSSAPQTKPVAAADSKELSAEQKRRHRAIEAAFSAGRLRELGGVDVRLQPGSPCPVQKPKDHHFGRPHRLRHCLCCDGCPRAGA
jgi:hypothetical protein